MINSSSNQIYSEYAKTDDYNIIFSSSKNTNYNYDNNESSNLFFPKKTIQRKNSATQLTAHNYQFKNYLDFLSNLTIEDIDKAIYNTPVYEYTEKKVTTSNQNNPIKHSSTGMKRFNSSGHFCTLPSISPVIDETNNNNTNNDYSYLYVNPKISNTNSNNYNNKNNNISSNKGNKKSKPSNIPHPKFAKKKALPPKKDKQSNNKYNNNNYNYNNYNYNNYNYNQQIFSNENISNNYVVDNIVINENNDNKSKTILTGETITNTISSTSSIDTNYNNYSNYYNTENEEPSSNFKLSEFTPLNQIGNGSEGSITIVNWIKNNKNYALKKCEIIYDEDIKNKKDVHKLLKEFIDYTLNESIIKTYGILSLTNKFGTYYFYELMEIAEKDWEQEITYRQKSKLYYKEYELMSIFTDLIKTFSALQTRHFTHRDIKPENIMIVNGKFKICDFGNAKLIKRDGVIVQKIRGSELFMSPIVFKALHSGMQSVKHNTFKSDVFSLGMCFFYAATLHVGGLNTIREIYDMNVIKKVLNHYLGKRYSQNLIGILTHMLQVDESKRPDFEQLELLLLI